jgi:hypothetical protein
MDLMENHFHLVATTREGNLSKVDASGEEPRTRPTIIAGSGSGASVSGQIQEYGD